MRGKNSDSKPKTETHQKVYLLGDVVSVDDGRGAQQLLEFLGFKGLWEALQCYQQQLQLLWSPEG